MGDCRRCHYNPLVHPNSWNRLSYFNLAHLCWVSTFVWMILMISSYLSAYKSNCIRGISKFLRFAGQTLALCIMVSIILNCFLQFANFYNRCYCNSVVSFLGNGSYDVFWTRNPVVLFLGFIWLSSHNTTPPPPPIIEGANAGRIASANANANASASASANESLHIPLIIRNHSRSRGRGRNEYHDIAIEMQPIISGTTPSPGPSTST